MVFFADWKLVGCGKAVKDIDVPLRLSLLKPCHPEWLVECYNHMTNTAVQNVTQSGWKAARTTEALQVESKGWGYLIRFKRLTH